LEHENSKRENENLIQKNKKLEEKIIIIAKENKEKIKNEVKNYYFFFFIISLLYFTLFIHFFPLFSLHSLNVEIFIK
jgi:hypothetical protein